MKVVLKIKRFNPERDATPYFAEYSVNTEPDKRLLDVLMDIRYTRDSTLTFRKSCAHGVCGSDAMIINGKERLACKTLVRDITEEEGATITIEPLNAMAVKRDLWVDQDDFFRKYQHIKPFLMNEKKDDGKEFIQSQEDRNKFEDPTKCILCAACYSSCPIIFEKNKNFIGPAASSQAARFVFDTRDTATEERLRLLNQPEGIGLCENHFQCTKVCPRGIKITKNINMLKRKSKEFENNQKH